MDAPAQRLGIYLTDELISRLLNDAEVRVVSRQDFERLLDEQGLQMAANFDDDSTAKIGHNLGWGTIVYGAIDPLQNAYRLSLRAVDVESGELRGARSYVLQSDALLESLVNPNITVP
jgi:curli biogenesis system outer membrane secretion channel CsgG